MNEDTVLFEQNRIAGAQRKRELRKSKEISLTPAQETHQGPGMRQYWIDQPQPETPHLIPLPRDVLGHRRQHVFRHHVLEKTSSVVLCYATLFCHAIALLPGAFSLPAMYRTFL